MNINNTININNKQFNITPSNTLFKHFIYDNIQPKEQLFHITKSNEDDNMCSKFINEITKSPFITNSIAHNNNNITNKVINSHSKYNRDIPLIMFLFKQIPFFKKLLIINRIDDITLRQLSTYIQHIHIDKNQHINCKYDSNIAFYCIIKGKVGLYKQTKQSNILISTLEQGDYFGNYSVVYSMHSKYNSIIAIDNCDMFYLTQENYDNILSKQFKKTIKTEKDFLMQAFPLLNTTGNIDYIYRNIKKCYYTNNQLVYNEHDIASNIYIVYHGEFSVKKMNICKTLNKNIIHLCKGEFIGLEAICSKDDDMPVYKTSLIARCEFNVLFCISYDVIKTVYRGKVKLFLEELYNKRRKEVNEFEVKEKRINDKYRILFREKDLHLKLNSFYNEDTVTKTFNSIEGFLNSRSCNNIHNKQTKKIRLLKACFSPGNVINRKCSLKLNCCSIINNKHNEGGDGCVSDKKITNGSNDNNNNIHQDIITNNNNHKKSRNIHNMKLTYDHTHHHKHKQTNTTLTKTIYKTIRNYTRNRHNSIDNHYQYNSGGMTLPLVSLIINNIQK